MKVYALIDWENNSLIAVASTRVEVLQKVADYANDCDLEVDDEATAEDIMDYFDETVTIEEAELKD